MKRGEKNKKTPGLLEQSRFLKVCSLLNENNVKYLIVGGMALNLHGVIRATKDIDVLIPRDRKNTEKALKALSGLFFGVASELDAETVSQKPITIIGDIPRVDLLTVANKVRYEQAQKTALRTKINKVTVPYVDYATFIKTKQIDRLQDKADLEVLKQIKGKTK